jgi:hypothetical protein
MRQRHTMQALTLPGQAVNLEKVSASRAPLGVQFAEAEALPIYHLNALFEC